MHNVRESLSALDEAMLVRGLLGKLRQSKSCETLVALGLFDDLAEELTTQGMEVARDILATPSNVAREHFYTKLVLDQTEVLPHLEPTDLIEDDFCLPIDEEGC